ncbi:hypothetical protein SDC9_50942 [bioreactor metagenome]|uniref:Thiol-disulfide oxidoreductase ResA n=1 Tax=bioreactor metagenome TaxID=1076179 RepID=A0A644WQU5_9ZZZZ
MFVLIVWQDLRKKFFVYGIPYSVMISPEGKLVMGGLRGAHLDAAIIKLLNNASEN